MKKIVSILAIVLAFTMMMSLTSFAAASFEIKEDAPTYEGTTVTPAADSIAVTTATTAGNYYGVLLVEGNTLPTVDTDILYIDQVTADATSETLNVLPIIPAVNTDVTLYISSNVAGAELIAIPMAYAEEVVTPTNDYITTADTTKGTIKVDVASVTANVMGLLKGKSVVSLALDTTAYPAAGADAAGYIIKAVNADGTDIEGASVFYSKERKKYVAAIPTTVTDYKFEVLASDAEGATDNDVIVKYADFTSDGKVILPDYMKFANIYKGKALTGSIKDALIADVTGDGNVNLPDYMQFANIYKNKPYNFPVLTK